MAVTLAAETPEADRRITLTAGSPEALAYRKYALKNCNIALIILAVALLPVVVVGVLGITKVISLARPTSISLTAAPAFLLLLSYFRETIYYRIILGYNISENNKRTKDAVDRLCKYIPLVTVSTGAYVDSGGHANPPPGVWKAITTADTYIVTEDNYVTMSTTIQRKIDEYTAQSLAVALRSQSILNQDVRLGPVGGGTSIELLLLVKP